MEFYLRPEHRENITTEELARHIFQIVKEAEMEKDYGRNYGPFYWINEDDSHLFYFRAKELFARFFTGPDGSKDKNNLPFFIKCQEAVELLKRRGLIISYIMGGLFFTSVGERSNFHNDVLILIDDAKEIVNALKQEVPDLDPIIEQYYLESLRTCQEGLYISSVICLGAASERAIHCLADAIIEHNCKYAEGINKVRKDISELIRYLSENIKNLSDSLIDGSFMRELREELDGIAFIYRRNRNKAGHPKEILDIGRCEQENYLNSFRRYAITIFKAIDLLNPNP